MKSKTIILSILMLPILIGLASACSCIYFEDVNSKFKNAEYVFTMKVEDITLTPIITEEMQEATVRIIQYWKPSEFPEAVNLKLYSNQDTGANCGYNFEVGQEYLIYAYIDIETGRLQTNSCMGNIELSKAQDEIKELNKITNKPSIPKPNQQAEPIEENIFTKFFDWFKSLFS